MLLAACAMNPADVPELGHETLCDIVVHRDTTRAVRNAAYEELQRRDLRCDRLATVMRRDRISGLRQHVDQEDPEATRPTYTDCVLNPICQETR